MLKPDFGEADAIIAGVKYRAHFFVMTLPHSDAMLRCGLPGGDDGGLAGRAQQSLCFFRRRSPIDSLRQRQVSGCRAYLSDGTRQRTRRSCGLQSHYLFEDRYGRPRQGFSTKAMWRGWSALMPGGYFMTPLPRFASWDAFNGHLSRAMPQPARQRPARPPREHRRTVLCVTAKR